MAVQTMGQLYVGQSFGTKWNKAWSENWQPVVAVARNLTLDQFPQDLFDGLLAVTFWRVVDTNYDGKVPHKIEDVCFVPDRPERDYLTELAAFVVD